jgi:hypothetical protein
MKKITAHHLKSDKKEKSSEVSAIIHSKLHDIQTRLHVMLLEVELLCRNQTALLNSQLIFDYLERVDESLQSSREHFSLDASIKGKKRVGKALNPRSDKQRSPSRRFRF